MGGTKRNNRPPKGNRYPSNIPPITIFPSSGYNDLASKIEFKTQFEIEVWENEVKTVFRS